VRGRFLAAFFLDLENQLDPGQMTIDPPRYEFLPIESAPGKSLRRPRSSIRKELETPILLNQTYEQGSASQVD
jgi:hypothetical protein